MAEPPSLEPIIRRLAAADEMLEGRLRHEGTFPAYPMAELYGIQDHIARLGALTTRLLQHTWQAHGELPRAFREVNPVLLGGAILPARMHASPGETYGEEPIPLAITADRTIEGTQGTFAFGKNDQGERLIKIFNSIVGYRRNLPNINSVRNHFGWDVATTFETLAWNCNKITGKRTLYMRSEGGRGRYLAASRNLHIEDRRAA